MASPSREPGRQKHYRGHDGARGLGGISRRGVGSLRLEIEEILDSASRFWSSVISTERPHSGVEFSQERAARHLPRREDRPRRSSSWTAPKPSKPPGCGSRRCRRRTSRRLRQDWPPSNAATRNLPGSSHPDIKCVPRGDWPEGRIRGREAALGLFGGRRGAVGAGPYELDEVADGGDLVAVRVRRHCVASPAASRSNSTFGLSPPSARERSLGLSGSRIARKPSKPPGCGSSGSLPLWTRSGYRIGATATDAKNPRIGHLCRKEIRRPSIWHPSARRTATIWSRPLRRAAPAGAAFRIGGNSVGGQAPARQCTFGTTHSLYFSSVVESAALDESSPLLCMERSGERREPDRATELVAGALGAAMRLCVLAQPPWRRGEGRLRAASAASPDGRSFSVRCRRIRRGRSFLPPSARSVAPA